MCSLHSLNTFYELLKAEIIVAMYSWAKCSSGWSASSPIHRSPLFRSTLMVHRAWMVHPKCQPWWTSGSVPDLYRKLSVACLVRKHKNYMVFSVNWVAKHFAASSQQWEQCSRQKTWYCSRIQMKMVENQNDDSLHTRSWSINTSNGLETWWGSFSWAVKYSTKTEETQRVFCGKSKYLNCPKQLSCDLDFSEI